MDCGLYLGVLVGVVEFQGSDSPSCGNVDSQIQQFQYLNVVYG